MILSANDLSANRIDNSQNIVRVHSENKDSSYNSAAERKDFEETAVALSISSDGYRRLAQETAKNKDVVRVKETKDDVNNVYARIQKYMNRSLQLENEASDKNISQVDKLTIQKEINKITLVVNNLSNSSEMDATSLMENQIKLVGDLVNHKTENISLSTENKAFAKFANEEHLINLLA